MLIINDFFVRYKEAISNQMEKIMMVKLYQQLDLWDKKQCKKMI